MIFTVVGYIIGGAATTLIAGMLMDMGWTKTAAYSGTGQFWSYRDNYDSDNRLGCQRKTQS